MAPILPGIRPGEYNHVLRVLTSRVPPLVRSSEWFLLDGKSSHGKVY